MQEKEKMVDQILVELDMISILSQLCDFSLRADIEINDSDYLHVIFEDHKNRCTKIGELVHELGKYQKSIRA